LYLNEFKELKYLNGVETFSFKLFIHLSSENFQTKSIVSKKLFKTIFFSSTFIQKGLQKFIKSLPNCIQTPAPIHFPFSLLPSRYFYIKNDT
jgi:hypothetical protein